MRTRSHIVWFTLIYHFCPWPPFGQQTESTDRKAGKRKNGPTVIIMMLVTVSMLLQERLTSECTVTACVTAIKAVPLERRYGWLLDHQGNVVCKDLLLCINVVHGIKTGTHVTALTLTFRSPRWHIVEASERAMPADSLQVG